MHMRMAEQASVVLNTSYHTAEFAERSIVPFQQCQRRRPAARATLSSRRCRFDAAIGLSAATSKRYLEPAGRLPGSSARYAVMAT